MYIAGEWRSALSGRTFESTNPASGSVLGTVPDGDRADARAAIDAAAAALPLICSEETFGPIAPVMVFDDESEAVDLANSTRYRLAAYLYTRDITRAIRVAEALDFGMIGINDINPTSAAVPFGGIKESGLGREGARAGIAEYLDTKVLGVAL